MMCSFPSGRELALSGCASDSRISNRRQRKRKKSARPFPRDPIRRASFPSIACRGAERAGPPPSGEHGAGRCLRRADLSPTPLRAAGPGPKGSEPRPPRNRRKPRWPAAPSGGAGVSLSGSPEAGAAPHARPGTRPSRPPFYSRLLPPPPPPRAGPRPDPKPPARSGPSIPSSSSPSGRSRPPFCLRPPPAPLAPLPRPAAILWPLPPSLSPRPGTASLGRRSPS